MKTLILTLLLFGAGCASYAAPPDFASMSAQEFQTWQGNQALRAQRQANYHAMQARQRAFMEAAQRDAMRHQARGMCAVNGSC